MADFEDNNPFADGDEGFDVISPSGGSQLDAETVDQAPVVHAANRPYTSRIDQILDQQPDVEIHILEAGKSHEGSTRGFIVYAIKIGEIVVRRRYSEFESMRTTLTRLFPTVIVPPIPEKQRVSEYAIAPTRAKEDVHVIEHRQRMLAVFLNRCLAIPQIRGSSVFQRFLDPNSSWSEVCTSPPVSTLPRNILQAPPVDPSSATAAHSYLPIPSSSAKLRSDGSAFDDEEERGKQYEAVVSSGLEKVNRRIMKRYSELATYTSELGARFNAFSLEEQGSTANVIEKMGQAADNMYITSEAMVASLSQTFGEPLGECSQFVEAMRSVLKYRRQKAIQKELTNELLISKRQLLTSLEQSEQEAQRINNYLQDGPPPATSQTSQSAILPTSDSDPTSSSPVRPRSTSITSGEEVHHTSSSKLFKIPGMSSINNAIHGLMDVDPEATRRNNIGKTREQITQLEDALIVADADIKVVNEEVQADLDRFHNARQQDLRKMMVAYLECHIEWAKKNLESWQDARAECDRV